MSMMMRAVVAGGKVNTYGRAFGSDNFLEGAILTGINVVCSRKKFNTVLELCLLKRDFDID
jgi:uncharacterized membrane protein (DUF485 family)